MLAYTLSAGLHVGFEHYLDLRDDSMLGTLAEGWQRRLDARAAERHEGPDALRAFLVHRFGDEMHALAARGGARLDRATTTPAMRRAAALASIVPRVMIFDPDGKQLFGPRPPRFRKTAAHVIGRTLSAGNMPVATIRLLPRPPLTLGSEDDFLRQRYVTLAWSIVGVTLAGVLLAAIAAGYISRWMRSVIDSLEQIADRRFDARLPSSGITIEQRQIANGISDMVDALQAADGQRRQWLAEISHELRTPLTVLRGEVDALLDGVRSIDTKALLSLRDETDRLSRVTDDFHLLSIADIDGMPLQPMSADAATLCVSAAARWSNVAREHGLSLEFTPPDERLPVTWDVEKMGRVFDNLMSNSVRYTAGPGIVRIHCDGDDRDVRVSIEDSAPGVPEMDIARIFQPLYRVAGSRSRRTGGSGLGLAIVRTVVDSHGGTIDAAPSALGGLRIAMTIPRDGGHA